MERHLKPQIDTVKKANVKRLHKLYDILEKAKLQRLKRLKRSMVSRGIWEGMMNRLNTEDF